MAGVADSGPESPFADRERVFDRSIGPRGAGDGNDRKRSGPVDREAESPSCTAHPSRWARGSNGGGLRVRFVFPQSPETAHARRSTLRFLASQNTEGSSVLPAPFHHHHALFEIPFRMLSASGPAFRTASTLPG